MHRSAHRLAGDLGIAVRDRDRGLLVQAQQHLRRGVADVVDEAVVQAAIARAGIERDVGNVEVAQHLGDDVAAEAGGIGAGRDRTLDGGGVDLVRWFAAERTRLRVWTSGRGFLIRRIGDAIQADHELSRNRAGTRRPA